jgi:uncharacterized membrane protein/Mg-chelatase subunit ChlD
VPTFERPILLLLLLPVGLLIYLTWQNMSLPYGKKQRGLILGSRLALFTSLILALAGTSWTLPVNKQATVFVGDISASTSVQRTFIEQQIQTALQHKRAEDQVGIVAVGRNALVEQSVQTQIDFSHFESTPDTNYTDLAAGLRLASAIMPDNIERHIVVLTDGQQNLEDALQQAQLLQQQGIRLDVIPLPGTATAEARIDGFDAPTNLHINEHFPLHIKVNSSVAQTATLRLYQDSTLISQQKITLPAGEQDFSHNMMAPDPGFHSYRVTIEPEHDTIAQNNEASTFVTVEGPPQILVIEGHPGSGRNIVAALQATKLDVTVGTPADVPTTLDALAKYSSVILADVPAIELGNTRMQILQSYVRDLGHGLVVSGGQNSYGVGGYSNTPLEQTLPVSMAIPQHKETPSIAVVLIVESLEEQVQINISKEAAKGVIGLLTPSDQVGISAGYGTLSIPMQHVTNKTAIDKAIDAMNPADPPSYNPDFKNAEQKLLATNARIKHIILLGDGDAYDNYQPEVTRLASENITVSTVETNAMAPEDFATMEEIAQWGKGRFYRADDPSTIPQILLQETETAARRSLINDTFTPAVVGSQPILSGLTGFPTLGGYVATTPKSAAQMVLVSHLDDPVLAVWQYGLGRVAAWTSDALGLWTKNWLTWDDSAHWWSNLVTWTLPASGSSALSINDQVINGSAQITVDLPPGTSSEGGQQQIKIHMIAPDLSQQDIKLQPTAPDRWQGDFPVEQVGTYLLQVTWQGANTKESLLTATTGLVVPYSAEFRTQGTDMRFINLLAHAGGGNVLDPKTTAETIYNEALTPATTSIPITFWLLMLAALLLPFDIATRRLSSLDFLAEGYQWLHKHMLPGHNEPAATVANTEKPERATPLSEIRARRNRLRPSPHPPVRPAPDRKSVTHTEPSTPVKDAPRQSTPQPTEETTASIIARLVEEKRKREQNKK